MWFVLGCLGLVVKVLGLLKKIEGLVVNSQKRNKLNKFRKAGFDFVTENITFAFGLLHK